MNVFQTTLAVSTYDQRDWEGLGVSIDTVGKLLYREEAVRVHEWVCRQGIVARKGEDVDVECSDEDRLALLEDIVLDFGRGIYRMAVDHARTNTHFATASLRKRLTADARSAYGIASKKWLDKIKFERTPLIPDVVFVASPRPQLSYSPR